ncbi:MAG: hypothetical protein V4492_07310, partial [Chlamydiota bacterium]
MTCGTPTSPATPVEPHLALPNRVLVGGPGKALFSPTPHRRPFSKGLSGAGSPARAILLCDLRPSAARALGFPRRTSSR